MAEQKRTGTICEHTFRRALTLLDGGDNARALELFRAGARNGAADCARMVGFCFDIGQGVEPSRTRALFWYRRAARLGDALGATMAGVLNAEQRRWHLAERWFRRAVGLGNPNAQLDLARVLARRGRSDEAAEHLWLLLRDPHVHEIARREAVELLRVLSD